MTHIANSDIQIRPLYDGESGTWTYLIIHNATHTCCLIDPILEKMDRDINLIRELNLELLFTIETHIHADHITSSGSLRQLTNCKTFVPEGAKIECATNFMKDLSKILLGDTALEILETPGHTEHSISIYIKNLCVFTGDALLIRGCGRTDFQGGNAELLYESITQKLFQLPEDTIVFPGHDYKGFVYSSIGEEKKLNPRVANKSKAEFVSFMQNLNLPYPKKIHEALPANENCGILK